MILVVIKFIKIQIQVKLMFYKFQFYLRPVFLNLIVGNPSNEKEQYNMRCQYNHIELMKNREIVKHL